MKTKVLITFMLWLLCSSMFFFIPAASADYGHSAYEAKYKKKYFNGDESPRLPPPPPPIRPKSSLKPVPSRAPIYPPICKSGGDSNCPPFT
ncbi:uncharacterized protein G2W53_042164 [Senna tora]|uniref:Uncharacterized protein n=1 Tax=Senna tora TaxID=362788 RepID=A0A834SIN2_9FABA|nr:uncharacterized protein G2W53_042164 [Senna tora]